jgi:hypothetical protein
MRRLAFALALLFASVAEVSSLVFTATQAASGACAFSASASMKMHPIRGAVFGLKPRSMFAARLASVEIPMLYLEDGLRERT